MRVEQVENINYCIGNLMYLPYCDECMDVVLNCFAPFFEHEFARIIKKSGYFIRVLPNVDHMFELKEILYKEVKLNELKETNLTEFELEEEYDLRYQKEFKNNLDLLHLFMMTPLYYKSSLKVLEMIKNIDNRITIHDFRMVIGSTHTNIIFDAVIPYDIKMSDKELKELISRKIKELNAQYNAVIEIDRPFTN
jgi:hypothetical protein